MSGSHRLSREDLLDLHRVFEEEIDDLLDQLESELASMASRALEDPGGALSRSPFRTAHNIKGAAAAVGAREVVEIAHELEEYLESLDAGQSPLTEVDSRQLSAMFERLALCARSFEPDPEEEPRDGSGESHRSEEGVRRIRVEAERLDNLMSYTGDLMADFSRQQDHHRRMQEIHGGLRALLDEGEAPDQRLRGLAEDLGVLLQDERRAVQATGRIISEMSDALKAVRMIPISEHAHQWKRIVREAAQALDRSARLHVDVGDMELDKYILDNLRDPLMHLLRNAVGHGIEPAEIRIELGKSPEGRILISSKMVGGLVRLELSDDGAGLDPQRIGMAAAERGLVTEVELGRMTREEVVDLLFEDGFSTELDVDEISGRGVGLSIVRKTVERIGGSVTAGDNPQGPGALFSVLLPPSMLSTNGLLVRSGKQTYMVPVSAVVKAHSTRDGSARAAGSREVFAVPGEAPLSLRRLADLAEGNSSGAGEDGRVLVLEHMGRQVGLQVEEILNQQEVVTKPLPWNIHRSPGVNGGVILEDGNLALSIDIPALFSSGAAAKKDAAGREASRPSRILVVDDAMTARTLQRNMLAAAGYDVVTCADGEAALEILEEGRFDLVVSDVQMPGMDGLELTRRIKTSAKHAGLPVILVTSLATEEDVRRGMSSGADDYIIKGQFDQRKLVKAVSGLL